MANARDIKRKITSVQNTQKITKVMKMVSAVKMRKAMETMMEARPYSEKLVDIIDEISCRSGGNGEHPFLEAREEVKTIGLILVTSDKGLCGAFNSNVIKMAHSFCQANKDKVVKLYLIGKKSFDFFKRRDYEIVNKWMGLGGKYSYSMAVEIGKITSTAFENEELDELHIIYNEWKSTSTQTLVEKKLLPMVVEGDKERVFPDFEYEPDMNSILEELFPQFINTMIFQGLLESAAGEHGARMVAMDNATRSADEVIKRLVLNYNKARQGAITTELLDIVNGAEALK